MNPHISYTLVAILVTVGTLSLIPAYAEVGLPPECPDCVGDSKKLVLIEAQHNTPIAIQTDSLVYDHNSMIMIEGKVAHIRLNTPVTMKVYNPLNSIVTIEQINVDKNGEFSTSLNTAGNLWKYDGTYTIRVQYGPQEINNKAFVELTDGTVVKDVPEILSCEKSELTVNNNCIPYSIVGGTITDANIINEDSLNTLVISISSVNDGMLTIEPMKQGCVEEGIPLVLVDGEESNDYTFSDKSIDIMFGAGTENIEIIGTCIVPEFGTLAILVLAVAIISIVAVTARTRLGVIPKF